MKNLLSFLLFVLIFWSSYAQKNSNEAKDIISYVVAKDTLVNKLEGIALSNKIKSGVITKQDSIAYAAQKKSLELRVFKKADNDAFRYYLEMDSKNNNRLAKYLSKEIVTKVIKSIPENSIHNIINLKDKGIVAYDKESVSGRCHSFSDPIEISSNRYIVYHYLLLNMDSWINEFIIYKIVKDEIQIEKTIEVEYF